MNIRKIRSSARSICGPRSRAHARAPTLEPLEERTLLSGSPGQTLATAENLGDIGNGTASINQTHTGVVEALAPDNYYTFSVSSATDVNIAGNFGGGQDVSLIIGQVAANGNANALEANSGVSDSVEQVLPAGQYYFEASAYIGGTYAPYTLALTAKPAPTGPGNSLATASDLGALNATGNQQYASDWASASFPDYYKFTVGGSSPLTVTVTASASGLELADSSGNSLVTGYETITQQLNPATYYIVVPDEGYDPGGYYSLDVNEGLTTYPPAPTPIPGSVNPIAPTPTPTPTPIPTPTPAPTPTSSDTTPPQASVRTPANFTIGSASSYYFNVTFTDNVALEAGNFADDVIVVGPNGSEIPDTVASTTTISPADVTVTYALPAPTGTGQYTIDLLGSQLADTSGNTAASGTLGTFNVTNSITAPTPTPTPTPAPTPTPVGSPSPTPTGTSSGVVVSIGSRLPTSVIGATPGVILLDLSNGTSVATAGGAVTIELFASTITTLDSSAVALGAPVTRLVKLKAGRSSPLRLKYEFPASLVQGSYYVLTKVTRAGASNVFVSVNTVNVIPATVDLAAAFPQHLATPLAPGGKGSVLISVVNSGNSPARGTINIVVSVVPSSGGAATEVITKAARVSLKPGKVATFRLRYRLPLTLAAGSYQFSATVQALAGLTDSNPANNTAMDPTPFTLA